MSDINKVKALFEHRDTWRHADESKSLHVYPRPMVAMIDALERELIRAETKGMENLINALDIE